MKATSEFTEKKQQMMNWVSKFGFAVEETPTGVRVYLTNRNVTVSEVESECHLKREYLMQMDDGVLVCLL